ncbi:hypothetical protein ACQP2U_43100 (plasmid) [Nocardia sp. CA-084685]|uniref:hypothetical protein n=1 Tax=Nocardia sp. CA-084685 TaxID=3239970 RepID=UPI003D9706DD
MRLQKGFAVVGRSEGNACARQVPAEVDTCTAGCDQAVTHAAVDAAEIERLNKDQRGRSWAIPVKSNAVASIPVWTSRAHWQQQVQEALASDRGQHFRAAQKVALQRVFAVAVAMSRVASSNTGRDVTLSNYRLAQMAGVSDRVVSRARRVLSDLGMAVEIERGRLLSPIERKAARAHHGGWQTRAASVWALTTPRNAAKIQTPRRHSATLGPRGRVASRIPQVGASGNLPPFRGVCSSSSVRENSPKRVRAREGRKPAKKKAVRLSPRPLDLQRAAAELVRHSHGLGRGHIGAIADAIAAADIDVTRYSGLDIAKRLTLDTQERGWNWPNSVTHPGRFLTARLTQMDWTARSPSEEAAQRAATASKRRLITEHALAERVCVAASAETRAHHMETIREILQRKGTRRTLSPNPASGSSQQRSVRLDDALEHGKPHLSWLVADNTSTEHPAAAPTPTPNPIGADSHEQQVASTAGDQCQLCMAPGTARETTPSNSTVCDDCWHSNGFDVLYPATTAASVMPEAV